MAHAWQGTVLGMSTKCEGTFPINFPQAALATKVVTVPEVILSCLREITTKRLLATLMYYEQLSERQAVCTRKEQTKWRATGRSKKNFGQRFSWTPLCRRCKLNLPYCSLPQSNLPGSGWLGKIRF